MCFIAFLFIASCPLGYGQHSSYEEDYDMAMEYIASYKNVKAESILNDLNQKIQISGDGNTYMGLKVTLRFAEVLEKRDKNEEARELLLHLIESSSDNEAFEVKAEANIILARMNEKMGQGAICYQYLEEARRYIELYDIDRLYPRYYVRSSSYQRIYGDQNLALDYAEKAVLTGKQQNQLVFEADGHFLLGSLVSSSDIEKAISEYSIAADHWRHIEDYSGYSFMKINIASIYMRKDLQDLALEQVDEALEFIKSASESETDIDEILAYLYNSKANVYRKNGMLDSVITYVEKSHIHKLLSMVRSSEKKLGEIVETHEWEKGRLDNQQKQRVQYLTFIFLSLSCLISIFLAYLLYNQRIQKRKVVDQSITLSKTNLELKKSLQNQKLLLAEVHHRVKNNLQIILSLVDLQKQKLQSEEAKNVLSEISKRIYSISLVHERLYETKKFDAVTVDEYLHELYIHSLNVDRTSQITAYQLNVPSIDLNIDTLVPLGMIISELINNSIKYSQLSKDQLFITTSIEQEGDEYILKYKDNGVGYTNGKLEAKKGSLGTLLITSMVRQLNGKLVYSAEDGAEVTIRFREKKTSIL